MHFILKNKLKIIFKKCKAKKVRYILGRNCAIAAMRLRSTTGGSSTFCSQPIGGLAGGDIRNNLLGSGGFK